MAGKKNKDEIPETAVADGIAEEVPAVEQPATAASGPPPSDYVILVNKTKGPLACPLRTGRNINLGPRVQGRELHRSDPILRKELTPILLSWQRMGKLGIESAGGAA